VTAVTVPRPGEVQAIIDRSPPAVARRMAGVETRLTEVMGQAAGPLSVHASSMIEAGGKRLRPLLVFLAAEAAGEPDPPSPGAGEAALVRAAVSVELVHSATLVHDDVLDAADLRRGRPTVVAAAGRPMAIAAGDLLFSRAFAELARNDSGAQLRALSDASSALAEGELLQREDAYATAVPLRRYLHRCELKTARLFAAAARLGALAGASPNALADALGSFAQGVGLAFQLLDDILDVSGPAARTGKRRGTDLLDGTVTLPLILAREHDEALAGIDLRTLGGPGGAEELCDRIAATGALVEARTHALRIIDEAKGHLPARLAPQTRRLFEQVADAVVDRYS